MRCQKLFHTARSLSPCIQTCRKSEKMKILQIGTEINHLPVTKTPASPPPQKKVECCSAGLIPGTCNSSDLCRVSVPVAIGWTQTSCKFLGLDYNPVDSWKQLWSKRTLGRSVLGGSFELGEYNGTGRKISPAASVLHRTVSASRPKYAKYVRLLSGSNRQRRGPLCVELPERDQSDASCRRRSENADEALEGRTNYTNRKEFIYFRPLLVVVVVVSSSSSSSSFSSSSSSSSSASLSCSLTMAVIIITAIIIVVFVVILQHRR